MIPTPTQQAPVRDLCTIWGGWHHSVVAEPGFHWMVLPRHGKRPAAFLGREMLRANDSALMRGFVSPTWHDIRIFELPALGYVTAARHLRASDGLPIWQDAWLSENGDDVMTALRDHDARGRLICAHTAPPGQACGHAACPWSMAASRPATGTACAEATARQWSALVDAVFGAAAAS
jgi:hypothetical protein